MSNKIYILTSHLVNNPYKKIEKHQTQLQRDNNKP